MAFANLNDKKKYEKKTHNRVASTGLNFPINQ